jgi:rhodanese-related sulfurtransferase
MTATISPPELAERRNVGKKFDLIDVRTPIEYREVHVDFARNVPLDQLDAAALVQDRHDSPDEPLYFICRTGSRAEKARDKLRAHGFTNVATVEGGTLACISAGLPVIRGKKSVSIERQVRIVAGALTLLGVLLGWLIHPWFFALSAFIGGGLLFAGLTDTCGMGMLLARMPWNKCGDSSNR